MKVHSEFFEEVKELVESVRGFLRNDDGNDDYFIEQMSRDSFYVLRKAEKIPELHDWVVRELAAGLVAAGEDTAEEERP
jgi:hypothetical protein